MNAAAAIRMLKPRYLPIISASFAVLIALTFWKIAPDVFNSPENMDYRAFYLPVAHNIINGQGISLNGKIALDYPAGYPILLAVILFPAKFLNITEELLLRISNLLLFALGAWLIFLLAEMLWDPYRALAASLIWTCYPLVLWTVKWPSTELPFMVILYAAAILLLKGWTGLRRSGFLFFLGGFSIGISMLIRPIAIGAGVVLAVLILLGRAHDLRRRVFFCVCLIAGNCFAILPWESWAVSQTHQVIPLCRGRASFSTFDGLTFAIWNPEGFRKGVAVPADVKEVMEKIVFRYAGNVKTGELLQFLSRQARERPLTVLKLIAIKAARSWYGTNSNRNEKFLLLVQGFFLIFLLRSASRVWRKLPESRHIVSAGVVLICYFWLMTISVLSIVRYMAPLLGAMIIFFPGVLPFQGKNGLKKAS